MDTPTPAGDAAGECLPGFFQTMDSLSPGLDSDFDESLAVPESLSVIEADKVDNKEGNSSSGKIFKDTFINKTTFFMVYPTAIKWQ